MERLQLRGVVALVVAAFSFIAFGSSAKAVQAVPNPGFEQDCSGGPCWWMAPGATGPGEFTTIGRDTSTVHSGQASLKVTTTSPFFLIGPRSGCFPLSPGMYSGSLFYNMPAASTATGIGFSITYFGAGDCDSSSILSSASNPTSPTKDGAWHQFNASFTAPAGAVSAYVLLQISCNDCSNAFAFFDDLSLDNGLPGIVPNPGFEQDCSGGPCWWMAPGATGPGEFTTIGRDTSTVHSGQASLKVTTTSPFFLIGPRSGCFPLSPGMYSGSLFYNMPAASTATGIGFSITYFGAGDCDSSSILSSASNPTSPTKDGAWHQFNASFTAPAGTVSAYVLLQISCNDCSNAFAFFDDVSFGSPTAASFLRVGASRDSRGVLVRWQTASEVNVLGFRVYRQSHGRRILLSRPLILGRGSIAGARYRFLDRSPGNASAARYWIQEIDRDGSRTWHGPASVSR